MSAKPQCTNSTLTRHHDAQTAGVPGNCNVGRCLHACGRAPACRARSSPRTAPGPQSRWPACSGCPPPASQGCALSTPHFSTCSRAAADCLMPLVNDPRKINTRTAGEVTRLLCRRWSAQKQRRGCAPAGTAGTRARGNACPAAPPRPWAPSRSGRCQRPGAQVNASVVCQH